MCEHNVCYMCDNARINNQLTDDNDLSFISVGSSTGNDYRILFGSGNDKPPRLLFEHWGGNRWHIVGFYEFKHCPNCGRKIIEYANESQ